MKIYIAGAITNNPVHKEQFAEAENCLGFDYIGFEIDKHYYELAQKRIEEEKAQIRLF